MFNGQKDPPGLMFNLAIKIVDIVVTIMLFQLGQDWEGWEDVSISHHVPFVPAGGASVQGEPLHTKSATGVKPVCVDVVANY